MKKVKKNFKKKLIIMEKSDPYLIRYHNSNSFIRAKELIPDYGDDENTKDKLRDLKDWRVENLEVESEV